MQHIKTCFGAVLHRNARGWQVPPPCTRVRNNLSLCLLIGQVRAIMLMTPVSLWESFLHSTRSGLGAIAETMCKGTEWLGGLENTGVLVKVQ
jgi:hypothetical protein